MMQVNAKNLAAALKAVTYREISSYPIINCVLITASPGALTVRTTNLEGSQTETIPAVGRDAWKTAAPMISKQKLEDPGATPRFYKRKLYPLIDYLKATGEAILSIDFDPKGEYLTIREGISTTKFKCINAMEFPPLTKH